MQFIVLKITKLKVFKYFWNQWRKSSNYSKNCREWTKDRRHEAFLNLTLSHFLSRLKVHWLKNISGQKGELLFYLWAAKRLLRGIPISMVPGFVIGFHINRDGLKRLTEIESGTGWGNREQRWGLTRTRKGERKGRRRWRREEGHEVRWKRSDLTAGEYFSLQRSHKRLTQPLNTQACACVSLWNTNIYTQTHTTPRSLFVSIALTHTHTHT